MVTSVAHHVARAIDASNPNLEGDYTPYGAHKAVQALELPLWAGPAPTAEKGLGIRGQPFAHPGLTQHRAAAGRDRGGRRNVWAVHGWWMAAHDRHDPRGRRLARSSERASIRGLAAGVTLPRRWSLGHSGAQTSAASFSARPRHRHSLAVLRGRHWRPLLGVDAHSASASGPPR